MSAKLGYRTLMGYPEKFQPQIRAYTLDLHRSVLHTALPVPYCFDCKSAALTKSGKKLLGIL